jgi:hypothetical protein
MDCRNCEDNYLYSIFESCFKNTVNADEALIRFDRICSRSEDPRNPLEIINNMNHNDCAKCKEYRKYYKDYI